MDTKTWDAFIALPEQAQCDRILDTMALVVGEAGEGYQYTMPVEGRCVYVSRAGTDRAEPSCLIGRVLARLGLPLAIMAEWDGLGDSRIGAVGASQGIGDEDALWVLSAAQRIQDDSLPWASALSMARESVRA